MMRPEVLPNYFARWCGVERAEDGRDVRPK